MAKSLWARDIMMGGVDPGQFSGHRVQSENLNIGSQVNLNIGSQVNTDNSVPKGGDDIDGNANEEGPREGGAVVTSRPRGRPKGSRNKPKPLLSATRENPNTLTCRSFEIPSGTDVRNTLEELACRRELAVFILSGNGMVSNVTLRNPAAPAGVVTYAGPLQIISISGAFSGGSENQEGTGITVSLVDVQSGVMVAGSVVGSLVAFDRVFVMAGTSVNIH